MCRTPIAYFHLVISGLAVLLFFLHRWCDFGPLLRGHTFLTMNNDAYDIEGIKKVLRHNQPQFEKLRRLVSRNSRGKASQCLLRDSIKASTDYHCCNELCCTKISAVVVLELRTDYILSGKASDQCVHRLRLRNLNLTCFSTRRTVFLKKNVYVASPECWGDHNVEPLQYHISGVHVCRKAVLKIFNISSHKVL